MGRNQNKYMIEELYFGMTEAEDDEKEISEQLKNALLTYERPSEFFEKLRNDRKLNTYFPEAGQLTGLMQDPIYHPEGDVWNHTMEVIDRAAAYREKSSNPLAFMLLALTHDFGKIKTTQYINGHWHAYKHEIEGIVLIKEFLSRLGEERSVIDYVINMVPLHMRPGQSAHDRSQVKSTNHLFDEAASPEDLIYFTLSDKPDISEDDVSFLWERLGLYRNLMSGSYVTEDDLLKSGLRPDEKMDDLLEYAHKLRLAGIEKNDAVIQVIGYSRDKKRKHRV